MISACCNFVGHNIYLVTYLKKGGLKIVKWSWPAVILDTIYILGCIPKKGGLKIVKWSQPAVILDIIYILGHIPTGGGLKISACCNFG
jgi:arginine exporter protein ArgO